MRTSFWKIFFVVVCCITACCTPDKSNQLEQPNISEIVKEKKNTVVVLPYEGNYKKYVEQQIVIIENLAQKIPDLLADRAGVEETFENQIEIQFLDWQENSRPFEISPQLREGKQVWLITCTTEFFQHEYFPAPDLYTRTLTDAKLRYHLGERYKDFPEWLWGGIVCYVSDTSEWLLANTILKMLFEENYHLLEVAQMIQGIASKKHAFPDLEGYMTLLYLEKKHSRAKAKEFLKELLSHEKDWESLLSEATGDPFFETHEKIKLFAMSYLGRRYQSIVLKYRQLLRLHIENQYVEAILMGKEMLIESESREDLLFLKNNIRYWNAMAHYQMKQYSHCIDNLQQIFAEPEMCYDISSAHYRYAMCFYHLEYLDRAIHAFADFQAKYPHHYFFDSSLYFLGECYDKRNEKTLALYWLEKFIEKYPDHKRHISSLTMAGEISLELFRLLQARIFFQKIKRSAQALDEQKKLAKEALENIYILENAQLPEAIAQQLQKKVEQYKDASFAVRKVLLEEVAMVGKVASLWLEEIIEHSPPDISDDIIQILKKAKEPALAPLLTKILEKQPKKSHDIMVAWVSMGIPSGDLLTFANVESRSPELQNTIRSAYDKVMWGTDIAVAEAHPELIVMLNEGEQSQLQAIEKYSLELDRKIIPTLVRLAQDHEEEQVRIKSLKILLLWEDARILQCFESCLGDSSAAVQMLALEGLGKFRKFPWQALQKLAYSDKLQVRLRALELLSEADSPQKWEVFIDLLDDNDIEVSVYARKTLSKEPSIEVISALLEKFVEEQHSVKFYSIIVQILEQLTDRSITYKPGMSLDERQSISAIIRKNLKN